jgi:cytochrome c-type biogenesis protein CcmF
MRRRRRYGAFLAHVGILMAAVGIAGSHFWQQERDLTLRPGSSVSVAGHVLTLDGVQQQTVGDHSETVAQLSLGDEALQPARLSYPALGGQSLTRVAIRSTAVEDLYVVLAGTSPDGSAALHVFVNPLVTWIWAGGALLVVGVLLGHLGRPVHEGKSAPATVRVPVLAR